jgi:HAD superfamily hydrolase (TIGR01490 family)
MTTTTLHAIDRPAPSAAAFIDLDGTLIPGSANIPLARAAFAAGFIGGADLARDLWHGVSFLLAGASDERSAQVRDRILRAVTGRAASDVEALADDFLADLVASVQPTMRAVLEEHAARGEDRVLLSASPTEIVSRVAAAAGLELGLGTTSERDADGVYTGRLSGPFCYGEGKAMVLRALAEERGYDLAACSAYSDSASDLPMLRAVGHPVAVNPEPALRAVAETEGWRVVETDALPRVPLTSARGLARLGRRAAGRVVDEAGQAASRLGGGAMGRLGLGGSGAAQLA